MEQNIDVLIAGYIGVDIVCEFHSRDTLLSMKPGKLLEMDGIGFALGGLVPNTGMALKKFGKKVWLNGLIGHDIMGKAAIEWLRQYDMADGIISTEKGDTACGIVVAPQEVDRVFLEYAGCNELFGIGHIDFDIVRKSRLFHFGYPPLLKQFYSDNGYQLKELFAKVKKLGAITSLDFSLPDTESESGKADWNQILTACLPNVDIFVPSIEEAIQISFPEKYNSLLRQSGSDNFIHQVPFELVQEVGRKFIDMGVRILLIKLGDKGAYLLTGDVSEVNMNIRDCLTDERWNYCEMICDAFPVDKDRFKNASGAGDTAAAAFLTAILDDENPETAIKYAALAGRNNLYCLNIYEELSNWPEMTFEIKTSKHPVREFHLP
jgi:sugar/nucleoside kinase (ribokinase family)